MPKKVPTQHRKIVVELAYDVHVNVSKSGSQRHQDTDDREFDRRVARAMRREIQRKERI